MAFFLGVAEGLDRQLERNLKRDMWLGEEGSKNRERLFARKIGVMQTLMEGRNREQKELADHMMVVKAFEDRLESVDSPEVRQAFLNVVKASPEWAAGFLETLIEKEPEGYRLEGDSLVDMYNVIEETRPDNVSYEDWTKEVADRVVDMETGVKQFGGMWSAALGAETVEELMPIEAAAGMDWAPDEPALAVDPNMSQILVSPTDDRTIEQLLTSTAISSYQQKLQGWREKMADGEGLSPTELAAYEHYLAVEGEILDDPAAIFKLPEFVSEAYGMIEPSHPYIRSIDRFNQYAPPPITPSAGNIVSSPPGSTSNVPDPIAPEPEFATPPIPAEEPNALQGGFRRSVFKQQ